MREILTAIRQETGREVPHTVKPPGRAIRPISSPMPPPPERVLNFVSRHSDLPTRDPHRLGSGTRRAHPLTRL